MPKKLMGRFGLLLKEKDSLEQLASSIPKELAKKFQSILKKEKISLNKGSVLVVQLFNEYFEKKKLSDFKPDKKDVYDVIKEYYGKEKSEMARFYCRVPSTDLEKFKVIRKRFNLKMYQACEIAVVLFLDYYKNNNK